VGRHHHRAGSLPLRMARLYLRPNGLRRSIDRLETAVLGLLAAAFIAVLVLAAFVGARVYRAEQAARPTGVHLAQAVLAPPGATDYSDPQRATAQATWRLSDGAERSGVLTSGSAPALYGKPSGASVLVWLDRAGNPVTPPSGPADTAVNATMAGLAVAVGGCAVLAVYYWACKRGLDRFRLASWRDAWSVTGPRWTSRQ
jgi:hypothetical protein